MPKRILSTGVTLHVSVSCFIFSWLILRKTASQSQQQRQGLDGDTHYLPSLVHPTLAMYSVPGNKELKGAASSLSCVLTICQYNNDTHTLGTSNNHAGEERKDYERLTLP